MQTFPKPVLCRKRTGKAVKIELVIFMVQTIIGSCDKCNGLSTGGPSSRYEYISKSKYANILRNRGDHVMNILRNRKNKSQLIWEHNNCNLFVRTVYKMQNDSKTVVQHTIKFP